LFRYADLKNDKDLAELAQEAAKQLLENDPAAAQAHVDRWLSGRHEFSRA
jgi:ATP-dependent DNA helicase RecG